MTGFLDWALIGVLAHYSLRAIRIARSSRELVGVPPGQDGSP